ncbi:MAG: adenosylcobinamide-phosphate synthase CbiB [Pseudomonadota bacterium]
MGDLHLFILLVALVLDWLFGEPEILWSRLPHPVVIFGKAVSFVDRKLNNSNATEAKQYKSGAIGIAILIGSAVLTGFLFERVTDAFGIFGIAIEVFFVFCLLAQKSLIEHVEAVATGLRNSGLDEARKAVGMIVGRDPKLLDKSGVCRAGIESLAESFSDGVVAPAFWYAIFGLPGLFAYKMINTADSMIGYKNEKYLYFGRAAARIDDLANWVPSRISAVLIAIGVATHKGFASAVVCIKTAYRDAGLHASPNAGWPESAMASACGLALGGPRVYPHGTVEQAYLNASGKRDLNAKDIDQSLKIFSRSCFVLWAIIFLLLI